MATSTVISDLAALEAVIKQDLLQTSGTPILTFLQSMQTITSTLAATPTPSAAQIAIAQAQSAAAWVTLQAGILGSLPNLAAEIVLALIEFFQTKLQTFLTPPTPAATPAK